jgi:hypothetical protein
MGLLPQSRVQGADRRSNRSAACELSCLGTGDYVLAHEVAIPDRCPITSVVPYTEAMEAADKAAAAAKAAKQ